LTLWQVLIKFGAEAKITDIITHAQFYDYHLRGFSVVIGQIWGFTVDFQLLLVLHCVHEKTITLDNVR